MEEWGGAEMECDNNTQTQEFFLLKIKIYLS